MNRNQKGAAQTTAIHNESQRKRKALHEVDNNDQELGANVSSKRSRISASITKKGQPHKPSQALNTMAMSPPQHSGQKVRQWSSAALLGRSSLRNKGGLATFKKEKNMNKGADDVGYEADDEKDEKSAKDSDEDDEE